MPNFVEIGKNMLSGWMDVWTLALIGRPIEALMLTFC